MSPDSRAFIDLVRAAEDPTPEDEARVLAAVRSTVVAAAATGIAASAANASKLVGLSGPSAIKLGVVVIGLTGGTWLVVSNLPERAAEQRPGRPAISAVAQPPRPELAPPQSTANPAPSAELETTQHTPAPRLRVPAEHPAPALPRPPSLREEIALLADVQRALESGDGAAALGLLESHATTDRQLAAERAAARIHALCALGRVDEARRAATEFVRSHPTSLQRAAVERSCAETVKPGGR